MSTTTESEDGEIEEDSYHPDTFSEGDFQVAGELTGEQRQQLRESLERHGFVPAMGQITVDEKDTIIDGHHRIGECQSLGIEIPAEGVRVFEGTWLEKRAEARRLNTESKGRNVTDQLKSDLIKQSITDYDENGEKVTDTQVAEECGADRSWVNRVRDRMAKNGQIVFAHNLPTSHQEDEARKLIRQGTHTQQEIADKTGLGRKKVREVQRELEQEHKEEPGKDSDSQSDESSSTQPETDKTSSSGIEAGSSSGDISPTTNGHADTQSSTGPDRDSSPTSESTSDPETERGVGTESHSSSRSRSGFDMGEEGDYHLEGEEPSDEHVKAVKDGIGEFRERVSTILDDPDVEERHEKFDALFAHMAIESVYHQLQCPECGSGPDNLQWSCCEIPADSAIERAHSALEESVSNAEEDSVSGVLANNDV